MLKTELEIVFFQPKENVCDGIQATNLRPPFRFCDGYSFSGFIESKRHIQFIYGEHYNVNVNFPTIESEAYEVIKDILSFNMILIIHIGSEEIGKGKLLKYEYV